MKKRTCTPFYGKTDQRLAAQAALLPPKKAAPLHAKIADRIRAKAEAARSRPAAPWLPNVKGMRYCLEGLVAR